MEKPVRKVCPPPEDLSVILNDLRCEKCNIHFKNLARYRMHNLKVHEKKNLTKLGNENKEDIHYHCPVKNCNYAINCERFFTQQRYLKQHYLKMHAEKKYPCTKCPKSFSTEAAKKAHIKVCGTDFNCKVCSKSYTSYEALLTHAKRNSHEVDQKYRKNSRQPKLKKRMGISAVHIPKLRTIMSTLPDTHKLLTLESKDIEKDQPKKRPVIISIQILPKFTQSVGVQTQVRSEPQCAESSSKNAKVKSEITQETQTNQIQKENTSQTSKETQTLNTIKKILKVTPRVQKHSIVKKLKIKSTESIINKDVTLTDNFVSENLFPSSPFPLRHDVGLPDLWEDKSTSATQTSPEKNIFSDLNNTITRDGLQTYCEEENSNSVNEYPFSGSNKITRADPMLTEEYTDRFSSIETQTEQAYCQSLFDSDSLSRTFTLNSNNETQTTGSFINMEPLQVYNHSCTQTCDEILPSDLGLSNIQTQTAWSHFVDTTVSTETQTRDLTCEPGCEDSNHDCRSWLSIQTNHMETQTDLLSMLEDLV